MKTTCVSKSPTKTSCNTSKKRKQKERERSPFIRLISGNNFLVCFILSPLLSSSLTIKTVLLVREFQLIAGDKAALGGKVFAVLSKSFIYASIFLFMNTDYQGANDRGGAIFTCVLFNSLVLPSPHSSLLIPLNHSSLTKVSLAELPNALRGRRMLAKHRSYAMYHASAAHIATVASDIPIIATQVYIYFYFYLFLFLFLFS
jgi:ATP-binding cassette, subfamily G (WHITE), member 2, SNQ2